MAVRALTRTHHAVVRISNGLLHCRYIYISIYEVLQRRIFVISYYFVNIELN
jgi:hypothetical protein